MAHCLDQYPVSFYSVQYGNTVVSPTGTNVVQVVQLIGHENFQRNISNQNVHDIGLVRVQRSINNQLYDHRVRLPLPFSSVPSGTWVKIKNSKKIDLIIPSVGHNTGLGL